MPCARATSSHERTAPGTLTLSAPRCGSTPFGKPVEPRGARRAAAAVVRDGARRVRIAHRTARIVHEPERVAADPAAGGVDDGEHRVRRDRRVDGVAAAPQHVEPVAVASACGEATIPRVERATARLGQALRSTVDHFRRISVR